jgi:hypothetical protein
MSVATEFDRQHLAASRSYLTAFYGWSGARLDGFLAAEQDLVRFDAPKKCVKGLACGNTCIAKGRTCRAKGNPQKAARLKELLMLPAAGQSSAAAMAKGNGGKEPIAQQKKAKNTAPPKATSEEKAKNQKSKTEINVLKASTTKDSITREIKIKTEDAAGKPVSVYAKIQGKTSDISLKKPAQRRESITDPEADWWPGALYNIHSRVPALGRQVGVKPLIELSSSDRQSPSIKAINIDFMTGPSRDTVGWSRRRTNLSTSNRADVARAVFRQAAEILKGLPDGSLVTCSAFASDGLGEQRMKMYKALGFQFPSGSKANDKPLGIALVKGGKIAKPQRMDSIENEDERLFVEAASQLPEFGAQVPPHRQPQGADLG